MSKRMLIVLIIIGLSALVVLDNAAVGKQIQAEAFVESSA